MREIKFRAWDKKNKQYFRECDFLYFCMGGIRFTWVDPERDTMMVTGLTTDNYELLQYTGLKDKNGKEIYEGDITNYGIVEWCECLNWDSGGSNHPGFYFKDNYLYGERGDLDYHTGFDGDIEVIGNIYENPELLEATEGND